MLSRIIVSILAFQLLSVVTGVQVEHNAAYDRVIKCMKAGFDAAKALKAGNAHIDKKALLCRFWEALYSCLTEPFDSADHSSEILDFFRAYEWQLGIMTTKSHLCTNLDFQGLKTLAQSSGIMSRENLPNIEDDPYEACAGDAHVKCVTSAETAWEHHVNDLGVFFVNINCYKQEAETCKAPMLQHMNVFVQTFKKHLQENHGFLANMVQGIKP